MRGHVVLSLKQLAGNSCKVLENVLCPAVIMSPDVKNDAESWVVTNRIDWKLNPAIFAQINHLEVDLFATCLITQCQRYFSWWQDPYVEATDAFLQNWIHCRGYANPLWNLIGKTISQV